MALEFKAIQPLEYYKKYFEQKIRPDGRDLCTVRPTSINISSITNAEGSAIVRLGNTAVVCGIKLEIAPPKPEEPKKGYLVPNIELPPLCAPHFRPGPPSEQAQVASQLVAKIAQNSNCINLEDLCIQEGKLVWVVYCDILCLNYDGTVIDPAVIALTAALKNLSLPKVTVDANSGEVKVEPTIKVPLRVQSNPVSTTFALFDNYIILVDPTYEEECLASGIMTIVTLDDGQLCGTYKPGGAGIYDVHIQECIAHAQKRGKQIRKLVTNALATL